MRVYLIRHAHALAADENPLRPLSHRGRREVAQLVAFFSANRQLDPAQLWHSPLTRSRETADLLLPALPPEVIRVETPGLEPEDDPVPTATRLDALEGDQAIAIVGHEPHLGELATLLIRGRRHPVAFHLRKSATLLLERTDSVHKRTGLARWRLRWHLSPELLAPLG